MASPVVITVETIERPRLVVWVGLWLAYFYIVRTRRVILPRWFTWLFFYRLRVVR